MTFGARLPGPFTRCADAGLTPYVRLSVVSLRGLLVLFVACRIRLFYEVKRAGGRASILSYCSSVLQDDDAALVHCIVDLALGDVVVGFGQVLVLVVGGLLLPTEDRVD